MTQTTTALSQSATDTHLNQLINEHLAHLPKIEDVVKGIILSISKQEIVLDIEGFTTGVIRGMEMKNIPIDINTLKIGDTLQAMVVDIDNEKGQMELSMKAALVENAWQFIKELEKDQTMVEVRIFGANKGGLLTSIHGMPAFLPVSQLIPEHYPRVEGGDKKKILKKLKTFVGVMLPVKVISFSADEQKVIISEKRAWEEMQKKKLAAYAPGGAVKAIIKTITNFGVFVEFDDKLEGLVHVSEIPAAEGENNAAPYNIGDRVEPKILDIKGSKVFLTLKT